MSRVPKGNSAAVNTESKQRRRHYALLVAKQDGSIAAYDLTKILQKALHGCLQADYWAVDSLQLSC